MDVLLVPTALHHYTVDEVQEEEARADEVTQLQTCQPLINACWSRRSQG